MPTKKDPHNEQTATGQNFPETRSYHTYPAQRAVVSMIATPIGNISDISKRARETIEQCDELWCEDTRHTQALLSALKIPSKRLRRVDQHTDPKEIFSLLKDVSEKRHRIGVVSDAGTPGVSDPGAKVVELAFQFPEIRVEPIAGPSAVTALLSIAAIQENSFSFLGFFPRDEKESLKLLQNLEETKLTRAFVFFESPHRIVETIAVLAKWIETLPERGMGHASLVLVKEISKIHETVYAGSGAKFLHAILHQHFDVPEKHKGEWCFVIDLSNFSVKNEKPEDDWVVTLECLISAGISTKEASTLISQRFSVAKNLAYKKALEVQKK